MPYAQTNYSQKQGMTVNGKAPVYTIAQIGCFITAFCNLLERFGSPISPPDIDNALAARRAYIDVDDGIFDDVGWGTVSAINGNVVVSSTGSGAPTSNNSIVKFNYKSPNTERFTTHFALVMNAAVGTILDSWDGRVKHWGVYGGPIAYATYVNNKPQPVQPINQGDIPMNDGDVTNLYRTILERDPDPGGLNTFRGKSWKEGFYGLADSAEYKQLRQNKAKQLADLQTALANEQNKPPKEVIKEVEKIVEVIKEVPVEVIKEVPSPVDEKQVVQNVFLRFWNSLFKKG